MVCRSLDIAGYVARAWAFRFAIIERGLSPDLAVRLEKPGPSYSRCPGHVRSSARLDELGTLAESIDELFALR